MNQPKQTLEQQLASASHEIRNLQVMAMRPDQPPAKVKLVQELERLLREESMLLREAIHQQAQLSPPDAPDEPPLPPTKSPPGLGPAGC